eukprot:Nk52_evm23s289 gene=Nk52_evmTU23s289
MCVFFVLPTSAAGSFIHSFESTNPIMPTKRKKQSPLLLLILLISFPNLIIAHPTGTKKHLIPPLHLTKYVLIKTPQHHQHKIDGHAQKKIKDHPPPLLVHAEEVQVDGEKNRIEKINNHPIGHKVIFVKPISNKSGEEETGGADDNDPKQKGYTNNINSTNNDNSLLLAARLEREEEGKEEIKKKRKRLETSQEYSDDYATLEINDGWRPREVVKSLHIDFTRVEKLINNRGTKEEEEGEIERIDIPGKEIHETTTSTMIKKKRPKKKKKEHGDSNLVIKKQRMKKKAKRNPQKKERETAHAGRSSDSKSESSYSNSPMDPAPRVQEFGVFEIPLGGYLSNKSSVLKVTFMSTPLLKLKFERIPVDDEKKEGEGSKPLYFSLTGLINRAQLLDVIWYNLRNSRPFTPPPPLLAQQQLGTRRRGGVNNNNPYRGIYGYPNRNPSWLLMAQRMNSYFYEDSDYEQTQQDSSPPLASNNPSLKDIDNLSAQSQSGYISPRQAPNLVHHLSVDFLAPPPVNKDEFYLLNGMINREKGLGKMNPLLNPIRRTRTAGFGIGAPRRRGSRPFNTAMRVNNNYWKSKKQKLPLNGQMIDTWDDIMSGIHQFRSSSVRFPPPLSSYSSSPSGAVDPTRLIHRREQWDPFVGEARDQVLKWQREFNQLVCDNQCKKFQIQFSIRVL